VREIMEDLAAGKEIIHGYLGLHLGSCTPEWARETNEKGGVEYLPEVYGAAITTVYSKTPAAIGGLKENDVILEIGSDRVRSADDARSLIDSSPVGKDLPITVMRGQRRVVLNVRLVDLAASLREKRAHQMKQLKQDTERFQELGPFRSMI
jgi:serine protease Do